MGITGLLPLLRPIQRRKHLSELFGLTIAVDGYVWLHRGAYTCAAEIVQKIPTRRYVDYCMSRVRTLKHYGINPYIVFDGGPLPAKLGTEKEREKKMEDARGRPVLTDYSENAPSRGTKFISAHLEISSRTIPRPMSNSSTLITE